MTTTRHTARAAIKTPITYYGGKQSMLPHILGKIPGHNVYTESFSGGLAVYWAKDPAKLEVINDLNGEVINFYTVLKTEYLALYEHIQTTLHSRRLYKDAMCIYNHPHLFDPVKRAWAFWVLTQQGFATKIGSWGYDKTSGTKEKKLDNQKLTFGVHLTRRLENTQIECNDALKVIQSRDSPDTFHYIDPPYINSNQGHYSGYTTKDFQQLLETLTSIKGRFLLSCYDSDIVNEYVSKQGWQKELHDMQLSASRNRKRKTEALIWNY